MKRTRLERREFLKGSMAAAAMALPFSQARGANDDVRVAVVGVGSRVKIGGKGAQEIDVFRKIPGVRVVALCDPDRDHLQREVEKAKDRHEEVAAYADVRRLLEDPGIDAIVNATPNHWHALITIWACQAGKDVFVEKPLCHNVWEGRRAVEAAKKYNRIVQVGSGSRSKTGFGEAHEFARQGNLGKILLARGINYKPRPTIGKVSGPQPIPKSLDYNLWAGPAPMEPLMREYLHYDWHWVWSTGNGDIGNMGIHYLDGCRWALGQTGLPRQVTSIGGRFAYVDDGQTPNTLITVLDYRPAPIIFEVRGLPKAKQFQDRRWDNSMDGYRGVRFGVVLHCEGGDVVNNVAYDRQGRQIKRFDRPGTNLRTNFIQAVRSRNAADLKSDVLQGHLSAALFHLANASHRLGEQSSQDEIRQAVRADGHALETVERLRDHLAANQVDFKRTPAVLGPRLKIHPEKEQFAGEFSARANRLLTRDYRKPFVVPEQV